MSKHEILVDDRTYESLREYPTIDLWYPRVGSGAKGVIVGLQDVRAADSIRISYDFDRDGWKVEQASVFSWDVDDEICDDGWQEVAFVQAWQLMKEDQ